MGEIISDAEFARRYGAVASPSSASFLSDDDFAARYPETRGRTGATGSWETESRHPHAQAGDAALRLIKGALTNLDPRALAEMVKNPLETVRALVDTREQFKDAGGAFARTMPGGAVEPSVMDDRSRLSHAQEGVYKAITAIPVVGPIAEGITENVSSSLREGDVAGAVGKGVGAALLARAPTAAQGAARGAAARGASMASNAEKSYAATLATEAAPLTESLARKMMDRGIVARNPAAMADDAASAATRAETQAAALSAAREATPAAVATDASTYGRSGARRGLAAARDTAVAEADFQRNIQAIFEAMPTSKSTGNVLLEGLTTAGKRGIGGYALATVADLGVSGGAATALTTGYTAIKTLKDLAQTPAFKTAAPIWKRKFGQAMQSKDLATAAEIGAEIASGALIADDFGHRDAVRALAAETERLPNPDLRRQLIASKGITYYVTPDGGRVAIPPSVMTAFVNAQKLSETDSPIVQWLTAMKKQGKIASGGTLEFGSSSRVQQ